MLQINEEQYQIWQREYKEKLDTDISLEELKKKELLLVTDKKGNFIKNKNGEIVARPRELCHFDGTWHRSVFVVVSDKHGRILIQIRAEEKFLGGCRDTSVAGHLGEIEEYVEGAKKETEEEIFNSEIEIDRSRFIQIGEEGHFELIVEKSENWIVKELLCISYLLQMKK